MNHTFKHCSSCGCEAGLRHNPATGTLFWGCSAHERTGCRWSASPVTGEEWGHAGVVARRNRTRGRVTSQRECVIAKLVGAGFDPSEAVAYVDAAGLLEALKLVA